ncbi:LWXIA domain-containing protein [Cupriavidus cauae]|uniref:LWXIA domain-containing protein n=1 Tax=Cupriavidus cauae TaxID=2608999 RepID=UPI002244AD58|nr:LWXIA domain-containing protein [Cupriavidus cauae]UZN51634.1 LWXIA domain-containing protein [Cupriavidus cauae]
MLDFKDLMQAREAILAAARAAAEAAARAAAEEARRAQAREAERQRQAQEAESARRNEQNNQAQQAQQAEQAQQAQQANQTQQADQKQQPDRAANNQPVDTPALYTPQTQPAGVVQVKGPGGDKPATDPAQQAREQKQNEAKGHTDRWHKDAKGAYDDSETKRNAGTMTDADWKPIEQKYGMVMAGAQNELRVAANQAAASGGDDKAITAAVDAKAREIRERYNDPVLDQNLDSIKDGFLKAEPTQEARDTQGARFQLGLAEERLDQAEATLQREEKALSEIPMGIRRADPESGQAVSDARAAVHEAQQTRDKAEETYLGTMRVEIDTLATQLYKKDADTKLSDVRNQPHDRSQSMTDRGYDLTEAQNRVDDAEAQLEALQAGKGVKVPDSYRQQAIEQLQGRYGSDQGMRTVIATADMQGRIAGEMEHLTPENEFERELAQTDPTTLAMAQVQGLTLDPDARMDPNSATPRDLSQQERDLMEFNPAAYVMYKSLGADYLVPAENAPPNDPTRRAFEAGVKNSGLVMYAFTETQRRAEGGEGVSKEDSAAAAAGMQRMLSLMRGSVPLREGYLQDNLSKKLDAGDFVGALKLRQGAANAAQTEQERERYLAVDGNRFDGEAFRAQIEASMRKDLEGKTHDDNYKPIIGQETMYADRVGQYMQQVAPYLTEEDATTLLDTVKSEYSNDWTGRNVAPSGGSYNDWNDFYHGLAAVVDAADAGYYARNPGSELGTGPAATSTASWLANEDNDVFTMVMQNQVGGTQGRIYGGAEDAAAKGHTSLSLAFAKELKDHDRAPPMADYDLTRAMDRGHEKYSGTEKAKEDQRRFELDKDEILQGTFDSLALRKDELTVKAGDDKALDNAIALAAPNADPKLIKEQLAEDVPEGATIKVIPMYVTGPGMSPYQSAVFEFVGKDGKTLWVDDQGAVYGKGDQPAERDFQENNELHDKGTVYLARDLSLGADGHAEFDDIDAHIVTDGEKFRAWLDIGVAAVGAIGGIGVMVASGGTLTPLVAAAWGGMLGSMGYGLAVTAVDANDMATHGRSLNPLDNARAFSLWANGFGSVAGMAGLGLGKGASLAMRAGGTLSGNSSTFSQMAARTLAGNANRMAIGSRVFNGAAFGSGAIMTGQQAITFAQHGGDMTLTEKLQNGAMLLMGMTQMMPAGIQIRSAQALHNAARRVTGRHPAAEAAAQAQALQQAMQAGDAPVNGRDADVPVRVRPGQDGAAQGRQPADTAGPLRAGEDGTGQQHGATGRPAAVPGRDGEADGVPPRVAAEPPADASPTPRSAASATDGTGSRSFTPQKLGTWQSVKLASRLTFDAAVAQGARLQDGVVNRMMDRAMQQAVTKYMREAGERSRHGDAPPAASRTNTSGRSRRRADARSDVRGDARPNVRSAVFAHGGGGRAAVLEAARAEPSIVLQNAISPLDRVSGMDGRAMSLSVPYGAELAARALHDVDTVLIATSPATLHGGADTHGPLGAVSLGAYLSALGKEVVYVTDPAHEALLADLLQGELGVADARIETFTATDSTRAAQQAQALLAKYRTQAVVAVEVAGRNRVGEYRLANGERLEGAPRVDQLLVEANAKDLVTVAIGADSHTAGMRSALERAMTSLHVEPADIDQWSAVGASHPVVGMNTNLAAQAVGFALQRASGADHAMPSTERVAAMIDRMAALHAYDSITLERGATSMRGLDKRSYLGVYELLQAQAKQLPEGLDLAQMLDGMQRRFVPKGVDPEQFGIKVIDDIIEVTVFDSSNGGILAAMNIARHIFSMTGKRVQLVAYGDHAAGTYGGRERDDLILRVNDGLHAMHQQQADANALGCNTACITYPEGWRGLDERDFINLIHTTARAMKADGGRNIALVATPGTVNSHAYRDAVGALRTGQNVLEIGANEWAAAVNALQHQATDGPELVAIQKLVAKYINADRIPAETETLWLCCTHYPALAKLIRQQLDASGLGHVKVIDPMQYQARALVDRLIERGVLKQEDLLPEPIPFEEVSAHDMLPLLAVTTGRASEVVRLAQGMTEDPRARAFGVPEFSASTDPGQIRGILDANRMPAAIDAMVTAYTGRNIDRLAIPQGALRAAAAMADSDVEHIVLLTGFSVARGMPETDGPPGTVALGAMLRAGGKRVSYIVDSANQPILEAALADMGQPLDSVHVFDEHADSTSPVVRAMLEEMQPDHVSSIELPGRTAAGTKHNMRGVNLDDFTPGIDAFLKAAQEMGIGTSSVGDGGNEAGMGNVAAFVPLAPDGTPIASTVRTDILVTASVSNWGAYAIGAAFLRQLGRAHLMPTENQILSAIEASVHAGAVDGVSRQQVPTVDGFSPEVHAAVYRFLRLWAGADSVTGPGAPVPALMGTAMPRRQPRAVLEDLFAHGLRRPFHGADDGGPGHARARQVPPIVDRSWSLRDGVPGDTAIATVIDSVHATGGRLADVKYVAVREADSVNARPKVIGAFDSPQQAAAQLDRQAAVGVKVRLQVVPDAQYRAGRVPSAEDAIGTVPLSRRDGRTVPGEIALNRAYEGDIRVALPEGFAEGKPLVRNEGGERIDVLQQLGHFPRARAHLDLAAEAGYVTFDNRAMPISVPQVPGYFTVRAEGAYQGVRMDMDGSGRPDYDAAALADRIRSHPDYREGMPVLIYDCFGMDGPLPLAQQLATALNARVHAPDGKWEIRGWYGDGDTVFGGAMHVDATPDAMAQSDAPVHSHGGRFYGAMPALPIVGVNEGGRALPESAFVMPRGNAPAPVRAGDTNTNANASHPAGWRAAPPRHADARFGASPLKVMAPDDYNVVLGRFDPERGLLDADGEAVGAHRLALELADAGKKGAAVVLAVDGGSQHARHAFAQKMADVMGVDVMLPAAGFKLDTLERAAGRPVDVNTDANAGGPPKPVLKLDQDGVAWQTLQPQPYRHANRSFAVDGVDAVRLIHDDGSQTPVDLADYLGPRLGSGAIKTVFALGNSHAVGLGNDSMIAAFPMGAEREAMAQVQALGMPTLRIHGGDGDTVLGHPAIVYERYLAGSAELLDGSGNLRPQYAARMNARTLRDLDAIEHGIENGADGRGLLLQDVEFAFFADGSVKIADVMSVEPGGGLAAHGQAVVTVLARMREAAQANVARVATDPQGAVRSATFRHGGEPEPEGAGLPEPNESSESGTSAESAEPAGAADPDSAAKAANAANVANAAQSGKSAKPVPEPEETAAAEAAAHSGDPAGDPAGAAKPAQPARPDPDTEQPPAAEGASQAGKPPQATPQPAPSSSAPTPTPRPWKLRATVAASVGGAFATGAAAMPFMPTPGTAAAVVVAGSCFIYRGGVAAGRTAFSNRVIRHVERQTPADIVWLRKALTGDRAAMWGISEKNREAFAKHLDVLERHVSAETSKPSTEEVAAAVQALKQAGTALLTPDTVAGRFNDGLQIGTLAINNATTVTWFMHHGVDLGNVATYSNTAFLAANGVLATFNVANRIAHHAKVKLPALPAAHTRKFVMSMYAAGAIPLAVTDVMTYGGVAGGIGAASLATFGVGAFLQSRVERGVANREFNKLAADKGGNIQLKPDQSLLPRKWEFFGRAMPYGLVLLGGGVIVNFGMKILLETLGSDEEDQPRTPTPEPTPSSSTPSVPSTQDPSPTQPATQEPPRSATPSEEPKPPSKEPPTTTEPPPQKPEPQPPQHPRPRNGRVVVQPYHAGVESGTLWGIAATNLDTLLSDGQKQEAEAEAMTTDEQVAAYALRELINLNPQYNLAQNPDHIEPGWELDVTR